MKKVIFCLLLPVIFQSCTDELKEIDSVMLTEDFVLGREINLSSKDVPHNSFAAFYYVNDNNKESVDHKIEGKIDHKFDKVKSEKTDLTAYWEGYFDFDSGDYEFVIGSDKQIKISIDDVMIFKGNTQNTSGTVKVAKSLSGIRRLKVFYNMNSAQKVKKIVEYYKNLRDANDDEEDDDSTGIPSATGGFNAGDASDISNILVNWRML